MRQEIYLMHILATKNVTSHNYRIHSTFFPFWAHAYYCIFFFPFLLHCEPSHSEKLPVEEELDAGVMQRTWSLLFSLSLSHIFPLWPTSPHPRDKNLQLWKYASTNALAYPRIRAVLNASISSIDYGNNQKSAKYVIIFYYYYYYSHRLARAHFSLMVCFSSNASAITFCMCRIPLR